MPRYITKGWIPGQQVRRKISQQPASQLRESCEWLETPVWHQQYVFHILLNAMIGSQAAAAYTTSSNGPTGPRFAIPDAAWPPVHNQALRSHAALAQPVEDLEDDEASLGPPDLHAHADQSSASHLERQPKLQHHEQLQQQPSQSRHDLQQQQQQEQQQQQPQLDLQKQSRLQQPQLRRVANKWAAKNHSSSEEFIESYRAALALSKQGQTKAAFHAFTAIIKEHRARPLDSVIHYVARASCARKLGWFDIALKDLLDAREADPRDPLVASNLARLFESRASFHIAVQLHSSAIEILPNRAIFWARRAYAQMKLHNHRAALEDFKVAIEVSLLHTLCSHARYFLDFYGKVYKKRCSTLLNGASC